jgi:ATP-dependent DNA helicase RecQ
MNFDNLLLLDLEVTPSGRIGELGAVMGKETLHAKKGAAKALAELTRFSAGAKALVGHNLIEHDLRYVRDADPRNALLDLPVIDTLPLSPICFPENPYHKLVKGYKLADEDRSDPVKDSKLSGKLLGDQIDVLNNLSDDDPNLASLYRTFLTSEGIDPQAVRGYEMLFDDLGIPALPNAEQARKITAETLAEKTCKSALDEFLENDSFPREHHAYLVSWLLVSGSNSVLPHWVCRRHPRCVERIKALREVPCSEPTCKYCPETHAPEKQLKKYFGFDEFRPEPSLEDGGSLQGAIVEAGMRNLPLLAILPTGGGKSLCFQIPALANHYRSGALTIVLSPLQALIKDQVENLRRQTGMHSSIDAIYGLQSKPERGGVYERLYLGDTAILYVSPEQLRTKRFGDSIARRQIARWVFDEAHCLSKWGHDFRPDYTYAGRFIREMAARQGVETPPVSCLTATAKMDVKQELLDYFEKELGQELATFDGGTERDNLTYDVSLVSEPEKAGRVHELLLDHFPDQNEGAAVVFCSKRKTVERLASYLEEQGWMAAGFHAGMENEEKTRLLDSFNQGVLQVMCATNAFGMGVDKPDVRLVVHHDIPGSLENYIQEAGRAGRDQEAAHCVLLYNAGKEGKGSDVDTQFSLDAYGRISKNDVKRILQSIRYRVAKQGDRRDGQAPHAFLSVSRILEEINTSFDEEYGSSKKTKVSTAIANLENAGFLKRDENQTRVFEGLPLVHKMEDALKIIRRTAPEKERNAWEDVYGTFLNLPKDVKPELEQFTELPSIASLLPGDKNDDPARAVFRILNRMSGPGVGLIRKDVGYSATLAHRQGEKSAGEVFAKLSQLEGAFIRSLQEHFPDAEAKQSYPLNLRRAVGLLAEEGFGWCHPVNLSKILSALRMDGTGLAGGDGSIVTTELGQDQFKIRLQVSLENLHVISEKRLAVSQLILEFIKSKIGDKERGLNVGVEFTESELLAMLKGDMYSQYKDPHAAVEHGLRYLQEMNVVQIKGGLGLITQAMRIELSEQSKGRKYSNADHKSLEVHYLEKNLQIHVMSEYAKLGARGIAKAIAFVLDYFALNKTAFVRKHFKGKAELLKLATTGESFERIVESLKNPRQQSIVAANKESNALILAGPGSGKTRTVAHRCAYLIRVERVKAESILVLCYNRSAASTLRKRIRDLCGQDAIGATICTFHSLALRMLGLSADLAFRNGSEGDNRESFDEIIPRATALLDGSKEAVGIDPEDMTSALIGRWNHILIDEYQDIDERQYDFVSAIAGRLVKEDEKGRKTKLSVLAVGDDDQNIYRFRGTSTHFIKRFREDYDAEVFHLLENYRSLRNVIFASNHLVAQNRDRMKHDDPIRIDAQREGCPAGGRWEEIDPVNEGLVRIMEIPGIRSQPGCALAEIERLRALSPDDFRWEDVAILGRTRSQLTPVRAILEENGVPLDWTCGMRDGFPIHKIREIQEGFDLLEKMQAERGAEPLVRPEETREAFEEYARSENVWKRLFFELVEDWSEEAGDFRQPIESCVQFAYDALYQMKADHRRGGGIFVGTAHGAKGLEFKHVFLLDGGWTDRAGELEDERRLFYVAMTRAMENLIIARAEDVRNVFADSLREAEGAFVRAAENCVKCDPVVLSRKYELLGMKDLYLDLGSRERAAREAVEKLSTNDPLFLREFDDRVSVFDSSDRRVATLSSGASEEWKTRLGEVESAKVFAVARRHRDDCSPEYRDRCIAETWEVPLVEVVLNSSSLPD